MYEQDIIATLTNADYLRTGMKEFQIGTKINLNGYDELRNCTVKNIESIKFESDTTISVKIKVLVPTEEDKEEVSEKPTKIIFFPMKQKELP